jgi:predicted DNA-binding transcriptional regulator YafY
MSDLDDVVFRHQLLSDGYVKAILSEGFAFPAYSDDDFEDKVDDDYVAPMVFRMSYLSSSGEKSDRVVRLIKLDDIDRDIRVSAWCYHREAYRSFFLSRIVEVSDISTGEVFEDARIFLADCGALKAETAEAKALRLCSDELAILAFVGSCDGLFKPEEKDEVVKHVCYSSDEPLNEQFI